MRSTLLALGLLAPLAACTKPAESAESPVEPALLADLKTIHDICSELMEVDPQEDRNPHNGTFSLRREVGNQSCNLSLLYDQRNPKLDRLVGAVDEKSGRTAVCSVHDVPPEVVCGTKKTSDPQIVQVTRDFLATF